MNATRQTEIEWSGQPLSVFFRPFRVSSHPPCLCECVRLIVEKWLKKRKKGERKKEKEKTPTQLPGFELALLRRPAVASMACQKDPSEMSRSRSQPSDVVLKANKGNRTCEVNRENNFCRKNYSRRECDLPNIFSLIADFRDVVSVL